MPSTTSRVSRPRVSSGISRSTDYSQFKFMEANREQSRGHVELLKKAFEEVGNLTRVQPILVNDNFEIIDGQHRFIACKELGLPIYYTLVEGLGVGEARSMNILHRNWTMDDYARSYAQTGDDNYRRYINLVEEYGFSHSITVQAAYGADRRGVFKEFRNGEFVLQDEGLTRRRLDFLDAVREILPLGVDTKLASALIKAFGKEGFNEAHMLRKLELHQGLVYKQPSVADYLRMLEDIYNYKMSDQHKVRLF